MAVFNQRSRTILKTSAMNCSIQQLTIGKIMMVSRMKNKTLFVNCTKVIDVLPSHNVTGFAALVETVPWSGDHDARVIKGFHELNIPEVRELKVISCDHEEVFVRGLRADIHGFRAITFL